ncbi:diguanylate cyclase domain-containing protein [Pseudoxanthomonas sacheonensis]|uniref:Diguanylate cyclase (GGDEF)-like protein/PAS domain S-box-containing protein n=1 Tax=Pseudoxanthomonas sacheonensis TaxID=443615 RepID=A0ABU1RRQ7_9GAMM|nr:diguanylate cyclase [Pseudoxanthomonas sacheonensis]MDR6841462.1 diguanylate cyclase (GGDEF)-like protein/PAS domain S-box-containing protein [Pseudoxanthomonas sacheonensis]
MNDDTSSQSHRTRLWRDRLIMALLIGATAWVSLNVARLPGEVSAVWVSSGIFVGWLLSRRTELWPGYVGAGFVAELLVRLLSGDGLGLSFALSAFNLLEVLIVAGMVRRLVPDIGNPTRWLGLGGIATSSTLAACAVSGLLASAVVSATSHTPFLTTFLIWYSAHVVGMVIVATLTLVAHRKGIGLSDVPGRRWIFLSDMLLIAVVCAAVFYQSSYPLLFLVYPPLLYGVFRHRFAGVVAGISLLAIVGGVATALGYGPLALVHDSNIIQRTILLQLFVGTACLMSFPVALSMAERARLTARVRESELRYRMLADYSHDVVVRMRADGQRLYVSPSARDILGWEPAELLRPSQDLVHPDDRAVQQQTIASVLASGHPVTAIYRLRHKDGHYVWMEAAARSIPSADGGAAMDIIFAGRDVSQRVAAEQALRESRNELEALARLDSLTGLANRRQFDERLTHALGRPRRQGLAVALMYMDIDHFKQVNDSYGHAAGDEVLRIFGQRLSACVRSGDLVARLGGDEFVVLIEDLSAPATAEMIARKLIESMGEGIAVGDSILHVTTSIGIAYSVHPAVAKTLTAAADAALYAAKKAGRNTWQLLPTDDARGRL